MYNFLDTILSFLTFPIARETTVEKIAYFTAIVLIVFAIALVVNLISKAKNHDSFFTCATMFILTILIASAALYWACLKIPASVDLIYPILKPHM